METKRGILVVSLDFELYWGVRDLCSIDEYAEKWGGERERIAEILDLFRDRGIHATWATVGLLFFAGKEEMLQGLPALKPAYSDPRLSPYGHIAGGGVGQGEDDDPHHFALSLIERIRSTPGQRIGSHTFSHYYSLEKGQTEWQFYSDLQAAADVAAKRGIPLESLVLPRNQIRRKYVGRLAELGIKTYRGNPQHRLYRDGYSVSDPPLKRALRLADSYFNLTGHHTYPAESLAPKAPLSLPASFFFRSPPRWLGWLEPLRLYRMRRSMTHAAKHGQVYHLWFHPYNAAEEAGMRALKRLANHFRRLAERYGMISLNMEELAEAVLAGRPAAEPGGRPAEGAGAEADAFPARAEETVSACRTSPGPSYSANEVKLHGH